ncbi:MAG: hypothetical protein AB7E47_03365 [Desulfovibrionaceae bacterium]
MKSDFFSPILAALAEMPGGAAQSELTIATGAATPTGALHTVDTEGDAATDDLDNIAVTNHPAGRLLVLSCANASRVVTVKHGSGGQGQVLLAGSADMDLDDTTRHLVLKRVGDNWEEVTRTRLVASGSEMAALTDADKLITAAALASRFRYELVWVPAGAFAPRDTNGAEFVPYEHPTNDVMGDYFACDSSVAEGMQWKFTLPETWDGATVKFKIKWTDDRNAGTASSGDTVEWGIRCRAYGDGDAIDGAWGTAVVISDTLLDPGDEHTTVATAACTIGGSPQAGDTVVVEVYRNVSGTGDMLEDAWFSQLGMQIGHANTSPQW